MLALVCTAGAALAGPPSNPAIAGDGSIIDAGADLAGQPFIAHNEQGDLMTPEIPDFGRCSADWDLDAELTSNDYFAFLMDYFEGEADYDENGVTDSDDFFSFVSSYFSGCP